MWLSVRVSKKAPTSMRWRRNCGRRKAASGRSVRSRLTHSRRVARAVLVLGLLAAVAAPTSFGDESAPQPTLSSDRATYAPGDAVTLSGSGWLPGSMVGIRVGDNGGNDWS